MKINILGTPYKLTHATQETEPRLQDCNGFCDKTTKQLVVDKLYYTDLGNIEEYKKKVIRHEIVHAFLFESGLHEGSWAGNEEIVDWIAAQFPKILKVFEEVDAL